MEKEILLISGLRSKLKEQLIFGSAKGMEEHKSKGSLMVA